MTTPGYVGRFAPSPTGDLHAGSLVAALASYLDARAHEGRWLLRIEDIDPPRTVPGAARRIVAGLLAHGMRPDGTVHVQSRRGAHYERALAQLQTAGRVYRCLCSRREMQPLARERARGNARVPACPRQCRENPPAPQRSCAWRLDVRGGSIRWQDRGDDAPTTEDLVQSTGDFVIRRREGLWSYQLAVVVDDAASGVTDVVRGDDLRSNTAQQCLLQQYLELPRPRYLHVPLVRNGAGEKLSKQTGAPAIVVRPDAATAIAQLNQAMAHLGLETIPAASLAAFWPRAIGQWRERRL